MYHGARERTENEVGTTRRRCLNLQATVIQSTLPAQCQKVHTSHWPVNRKLDSLSDAPINALNASVVMVGPVLSIT
jgi:hypothetical protein